MFWKYTHSVKRSHEDIGDLKTGNEMYGSGRCGRLPGACGARALALGGATFRLVARAVRQAETRGETVFCSFESHEEAFWLPRKVVSAC